MLSRETVATEMKPRDRLIVALDVDTLDAARSLITALSPHAGWFKVGSVLFTREGPRACEMIKDAGARLFLDLKYHDIPNTVSGAVTNALALGADMITLHASGGPTMLGAAREAADRAGRRDAVLVAVTVLTHLGEKELHAVSGSKERVVDRVLALARLAREGGMTGVVASAQELSAIKRAMGKEFVVVTPGIRLPDAGQDDQTRAVTPEQAIHDGADYLVVGRPIIAAKDPAAAAREFVARMG